MSVSWIDIEVIAVFFLATFVRSAFGFGEALIAVPLLALALPLQVAAPVAVLISITVAVIVLAQDWRQVHVRSAGRLVLSTLVGIPLGLFALTRLDERIVKACLGTVIAAFSLFTLSQRKKAVLHDDRFAGLFGFGAGVLGGAYGMNGPPLVMYGTLRGWSPGHFRATLQGYFLPASLMSMAGYWLAGLWTPAVDRCYLTTLPATLVAIPLGRVANRHMNGPVFLRVVHLGLIVTGALLLLQGLPA